MSILTEYSLEGATSRNEVLIKNKKEIVCALTNTHAEYPTTRKSHDVINRFSATAENPTTQEPTITAVATNKEVKTSVQEPVEGYLNEEHRCYKDKELKKKDEIIKKLQEKLEVKDEMIKKLKEQFSKK